jgi:hypothetical protein
MHIYYKIHRCYYNNLRSRRRPAATRMPCRCHPRTRSAQISTWWFPYEHSDEISTRPNPIQWVQKKIKPRVESNMVVTRTGSVTLRRCSRVAASGQRRPVTSMAPMMAPSDPVYIEEGGTDGIDGATPTSKPVASTPPVPTRRHGGHLPVIATGPGKP